MNLRLVSISQPQKRIFDAQTLASQRIRFLVKYDVPIALQEIQNFQSLRRHLFPGTSMELDENLAGLHSAVKPMGDRVPFTAFTIDDVWEERMFVSSKSVLQLEDERAGPWKECVCHAVPMQFPQRKRL